MSLLRRIYRFLTRADVREERERARRRENYEFLKARIAERHFAGFAGLTLDFFGKKFDAQDRAAFPLPMYCFIQNSKSQWCVFWDRSRMTREIGTGAPLKEGEALIADAKIRTKPDGTPETIDEQKPLTVPTPLTLLPSPTAAVPAEVSPSEPQSSSQDNV